MKVLVILSAVFFVGCEYKQSKEFKVETVDKRVITMLCPLIDPHQSKLTYLRSNECMVISVDKKGE